MSHQDRPLRDKKPIQEFRRRRRRLRRRPGWHVRSVIPRPPSLPFRLAVPVVLGDPVDRARLADLERPEYLALLEDQQGPVGPLRLWDPGHGRIRPAKSTDIVQREGPTSPLVSLLRFRPIQPRVIPGVNLDLTLARASKRCRGAGLVGGIYKTADHEWSEHLSIRWFSPENRWVNTRPSKLVPFCIAIGGRWCGEEFAQIVERLQLLTRATDSRDSANVM